MTQRRLEELLRQTEPRLRRRFRQALQRVKDRNTLARLESALESGTISEVLDDIERAAATFAAQTEAVTVLVANEVADRLSKQLDTVVTYDGTNPAAVAQIRANRLRMVQGLREEARATILDVLTEGTAGGVNPRQQAQGIRDSLGLTQQQAQWVRNYRRRLETLDTGALDGALRDARFDGTVKRAIAQGKPLPAKQVDKMVQRFADRALKYRAEVVARTETLRAVHQASETMYEQAIEDGTLDRDQLVCTWHAARDGRTRVSHAAMQGQRRRVGEAFTSGNGYPLKYPSDPDAPASETAQCRCTKSTKVFPSVEAARAYRDGVDELAPDAPPVTLPKGAESGLADAGARKKAMAFATKDLKNGNARAAWAKNMERDPEVYDATVNPDSGFSKRSFFEYRREWAKGLTDDQTDAALFYSLKGDQLLNAGAREGWLGSDAKLSAMAKRLDDVIDSHRVPESTRVLRGLGGKWADDFATALKPGDVFREPGYTSTTIMPTRGVKWDVAVKITIPRGAAAAPIPSQFANEGEILLPRGSRFRVRSVGEGTIVKDGKTVNLRVVEVDLLP